MNYIKEINAFERWLETNYLAAQSQLLWYRLMALCNRSGWPEWVIVDNQRLMGMIGCGSKNTFLRARDGLIEAGLVQYVKGKKGSPNKYHIVSFSSESEPYKWKGSFSEPQTEPYTEPQTELKTEPYTEPQTGPIYKHKHKLNKTKRESDARADEPTTDAENVQGRYGRFKNVILSDLQSKLLREEYGPGSEWMIKNLDNYLETHPVKKRLYQNHYATMVKWADEDAAKKQQGPAGKQGLSVHAQDGDPDTQRRGELLDEIERQQVDAVMNFGEELHET